MKTSWQRLQTGTWKCLLTGIYFKSLAGLTPNIHWIGSKLQVGICSLSASAVWNLSDKLVTTMNSFSRRCIGCASWTSLYRCWLAGFAQSELSESRIQRLHLSRVRVEEQMSAGRASCRGSRWLHSQTKGIIHKAFIVQESVWCSGLCSSTAFSR